MANLKEIRTRIASVTTTRQITSAMKMVSAAKLKRAQDAVLQLRPYVSKLSGILGNLYQYNDGYEDKTFFAQRGSDRILIVLVTSNRGLCGAFNNNAIKLALSLAHNEFRQSMQSKKLQFICMGKKGADYLRAKKYPLLAEYPEVVERPQFSSASQIAEKIIGLYQGGQFDRVVLVYNKFKNAAVQELVWEQFLPLSLPKSRKKDAKLSSVLTYVNDYILEPGKEAIIAEIVPVYLKSLFFRALLDSAASEHGARMTAMHKATDNATELLRQLTLNYNKARQASITSEILEIVGGAEALKG
ncbi:MAG: ATP synthase F1 subunit gamma [Bacteroidales bacterium]